MEKKFKVSIIFFTLAVLLEFISLYHSEFFINNFSVNKPAIFIMILQMIFAIVSLILGGIGLFKARNEGMKVKHIVVIIFLIMNCAIIFRGATGIVLVLKFLNM
ncbi:hypothetical protein [Clostridium ihumii]|uniref:hypothetical protein n=1 Tax=Clostridium ihumii TaxID=1470356 RepID=UPI00058F7248|nr:hypothetical protein [Clostridium ihumii]